MGETVKPLTKGKLSAYAGPVERLFSPAHVTMSFSQKHEIRETVVRDKVHCRPRCLSLYSAVLLLFYCDAVSVYKNTVSEVVITSPTRLCSTGQFCDHSKSGAVVTELASWVELSWVESGGVITVTKTQFNCTKNRQFAVIGRSSKRVQNFTTDSKLTTRRVEFGLHCPTRLSWSAEWPQHPTPVELSQVGLGDVIVA